MKKDRFVNPESKVLFSAAAVFILILSLSCGDGGYTGQSTEDDHQAVLTRGPWAVEFDPTDPVGMNFSLEVLQLRSAEQHGETDSLHFQAAGIPDSLRLNRKWYLGGGSVLMFSVVFSADAPLELQSAADRVRNGAVIVRPAGLRSVYLSDRSGDEIDEERASYAVEPPPKVSHYMRITYRPDDPDSSLIVVDSVVVDFSESTLDSLVFRFTEYNSAVITDTGRFSRGSSAEEYVCFADTTRLYSGVFISVLTMNRLYTDADLQVTGQSRLTSAYLTGRGFYPVSNTTQNYQLELRLPDSITAWVPLQNQGGGLWRSGPGGITGGLPVAIGNYRTRILQNRYRILVLDGGAADSLDSIAVNRIAGTLLRTLDFPSAEYTFVEIFNPDGATVIPAFGGLMFSRGSLGMLTDVSEWSDSISGGESPRGMDVLECVAEGLLMQSLQLDPVLHETLRAWFPIRYYAEQEGEGSGLRTMREAYLKYYLFNAEVLSSGAVTPYFAEFALADPELVSSPFRQFVSGGKGVIILEYLYSRRMLNRLPYLLQNFTHSSSGNYWLKIYSSFRIERDSYQYEILRRLFYLPGIPQISVEWMEEPGRIVFEATEIQPGEAFSFPLDSCMIYLRDTALVRAVSISPETGGYQCGAGPAGAGRVSAIDLNFRRTIPADFMYRRRETD